MKCRYFVADYYTLTAVKSSRSCTSLFPFALPMKLPWTQLTDTNEDSTAKDHKNHISLYITTGHFSYPRHIQGAFQNICRDKQ